MVTCQVTCQLSYRRSQSNIRARSSNIPDPTEPSTLLNYNTALATTLTRSVPNVECPLCFQPFPIDKVELHASDCQGSFAVVEENSIEICSNDGEFLEKENYNPSLVKCINNLIENFRRARSKYYTPNTLKILYA